MSSSPVPPPSPSAAPGPALGATWDGTGVTFALGSQHATGVDLVLFETTRSPVETRRIPLEPGAGGIWSVRVDGVGPGAAYGYRVHGPYDPGRGHRFNPAKLLIDPYARALTGSLVWHDAVFGYRRGAETTDEPDPRDSAPHVPRSLVVDPAFSWDGDRPPGHAWNDTVIYECHVKGMTQTCPDVPESLRGSYLGLAHETIIAHLHRLGVTAVELLPVHASVSEYAVVRRRLTNYWGYNTLGFFAPDARFAGADDGQQVLEFKSMVKALHQAGIEVILDVVYNHTAEGAADGPTLSLRGIDNAVYYALDPDDPAEYVNVTGTGNTLGMHHPLARRLLSDSLRYWVREMHVDGFRFDLAPALARTAPRGFTEFFAALRADPGLAGVKLIAEPWDAGGGYHVGGFPPGWAEWNGRFRDAARRFWRGDSGQRAEVASRLAGSSDLYDGGRTPQAGVNFVTCHDGFTLRDLVSYDGKHNEANGEQNRDGSPVNWSRNWGVEGPTDDPAIMEVRERMQRNLLATLMLSLGVPMLSHGDELGRSQRGNNNAYCQDNDLTWLDWTPSDASRRMRRFVELLAAVRRDNPLFRRDAFLTGRVVGAGRGPDAQWLGADGKPFEDEDWSDPSGAFLGMLLRGDRSVFLGLNAGEDSCTVPLPALGAGEWVVRVDTAQAEDRGGLEAVEVGGRSLVLCEWRRGAAHA